MLSKQLTRFMGLILVSMSYSAVCWAGPQGRISLTEADFISEDYKKTDRKDFQFISAGLDTLRNAEKESEISDSLQGQIQGLAAPGVSVLSYLNVSQLFWKQNALTVGRKKVNWSLLDEDYLLGLYQPLFRWNPLEPESQGLTGAFLNLENTEGPVRWGVTLFSSGIFIPDQGSGYDIKNGQFERSNPYFQATPRNAEISGHVVDINYNVQKPDTQEIVFNRSFAGRVFIGEEKKGFYGQVAFANKPSNQMSLGFDGVDQTNPEVTADTANLQIQPTISTHSLSSADIKFSTKFLSGGVSAVHEDPESPNFSEQWTFVKYSKSDLVSPFVQIEGVGFKLHLAYLSVEGGEALAVGKFASQSEKFLPQRYPFRSAGLASLSYRHGFGRFHGVTFSTRYLQGADSEFALWTTHMTYQWEERWAMYAQSQMVAVQDNQNGRMTAYWPFVNNDSVVLGVSYVF